MRDDQGFVVVEHETAVRVTGVTRRPAEVGVRHLVRVSELVCGMSGFVPKGVLIV